MDADSGRLGSVYKRLNVRPVELPTRWAVGRGVCHVLPPRVPFCTLAPSVPGSLRGSAGRPPPRAPGQEPRTHHCTTGVGNPCTVKQSFTDILSQTVWDLRRTRISGARRIRSKYE